MLNNSECERVMFESVIKVSLDNSVQLEFSENLKSDISKEDLGVYYDNKLCKFKVKMIRPNIASIECEITNDVIIGSYIEVEFYRPIISVANSLLSTKNLSINQVLKSFNFNLNLIIFIVLAF